VHSMGRATVKGSLREYCSVDWVISHVNLLPMFLLLYVSMYVYICCVLSGRGLCDELITRPEESYRLWCVVVCDLETSRMRRP